MLKSNTQALLVLEDGTTFYGRSIGAEGQTVGEVVFNTAITGYQEILTDPSYAKQLITLTYPHIGNVGTNPDDEESSTIHANGLIIRDLSQTVSHRQHKESLAEYLKKHNIVAIADIDTRKLTHILRKKGSQKGCIITGRTVEKVKNRAEEAQQAAVSFQGLNGVDLAKTVTCKSPYTWQSNDSFRATKQTVNSSARFHIVAYDFGIKHNILTLLAKQNCKVTVVPAMTKAEEAFALKPDGIFLSNGPGDPAACLYAINTIKTFLAKEIPLFGICLGHQLLSLALGAKTVKMKFGHHGSNHPVKDIIKNKVMITSQNHGFSVDESTLPKSTLVTHRSLFDGSLQGIRLRNKPAFSFQGHPEGSPGPQDISSLFDDFIALIISKINMKS